MGHFGTESSTNCEYQSCIIWRSNGGHILLHSHMENFIRTNIDKERNFCNTFAIINQPSKIRNFNGRKGTIIYSFHLICKFIANSVFRTAQHKHDLNNSHNTTKSLSTFSHIFFRKLMYCKSEGSFQNKWGQQGAVWEKKTSICFFYFAVLQKYINLDLLEKANLISHKASLFVSSLSPT